MSVTNHLAPSLASTKLGAPYQRLHITLDPDPDTTTIISFEELCADRAREQLARRQGGAATASTDNDISMLLADAGPMQPEDDAFFEQLLRNAQKYTMSDEEDDDEVSEMGW
jgi:hypothetical protein